MKRTRMLALVLGYATSLMVHAQSVEIIWPGPESKIEVMPSNEIAFTTSSELDYPVDIVFILNSLPSETLEREPVSFVHSVPLGFVGVWGGVHTFSFNIPPLWIGGQFVGGNSFQIEGYIIDPVALVWIKVCESKKFIITDIPTVKLTARDHGDQVLRPGQPRQYSLEWHGMPSTVNDVGMGFKVSLFIAPDTYHPPGDNSEVTVCTGSITNESGSMEIELALSAASEGIFPTEYVGILQLENNAQDRIAPVYVGSSNTPTNMSLKIQEIWGEPGVQNTLLLIEGTPRKQFGIETSLNLLNWELLDTARINPAGTALFQTQPLLGMNRFFRLVE